MQDDFTQGYLAGWRDALEEAMGILRLILQHKRKAAAARAERGRQLLAFRCRDRQGRR